MNYENVNVHLKHKNYEKVKIFVCNTGIMKIFCLQYMNYEDMKIFVCNTWIMKIFLQYTIHENMKIFVCKTWILKTQKCPFETHELWKNLNICLQNMNYENI